MKRSKRHRVKQEQPETSTSRSANQKEHDLAYYIHDRVELMHQVFTVLKPKELKAMAPECVRHISVNDLQELCMEELLGISSKRLCAILDGASPPSDTESSSESEQLETISLDSISSDEEILSQISSKKSKKHKHRSKSKPKKSKSKDKGDEDKDQADRSRRAGLTVLELLELQARARAIRAQLQQEQASAVSTGQPSESVTGNSSDDEVEIKEEAAEVVEISSEDEKPDIQNLEERIAAARKETISDALTNSTTVTKKVNDLIITVPKSNTSRKIKLKRNISSNSKADKNAPADDINHDKCSSSNVTVEKTSDINAIKKGSQTITQVIPTKTSVDTTISKISTSIKKCERTKEDTINTKEKSRVKDKRKKRKRDKQKDRDGSDHDEITLQLSDTEKMDLLEDLEGKKTEKCIDTEDSSADSSDENLIEEVSDEDKNQELSELDTHKTNLINIIVTTENCKEIENNDPVTIEETITNAEQMHEVKSPKSKTCSNSGDDTSDINGKDIATMNNKSDDINVPKIDIGKQRISIDNSEKLDLVINTLNSKENIVIETSDKNISTIDYEKEDNNSPNENTVKIRAKEDKTCNLKAITQDTELLQEENIDDCDGQAKEVEQNFSKDINTKDQLEELNIRDKVMESKTRNNENLSNVSNVESIDNSKEKSDGELSDRDSSEVEASDFKADVVCISDDEDRKERKKKKKDKKNKKEKKSKKKKDFRESADQNFYCETDTNVTSKRNTSQKEVIVISEIPVKCDSSKKCGGATIENIVKSKDKEIITLPDTETIQFEDVKLNETQIPETMNTHLNLDDDAYEILELSDDSSCYEVAEISISKEPTAEEIESLSAKLDEIERDITIDNKTLEGKDSEDIDTVSWKDRYLKSSKVKKVLTTANIMNAMRKKNLELKKKLQNSKKECETEDNKTENIKAGSNVFEDGSIEQYNTLEKSTKYVDPVKEAHGNTDNMTETKNEFECKTIHDQIGNSGNTAKDTVTNEMKKEAKQLLKMYKMLLKYNDMSKQKDPSKKKKKKKKKSKEKDKSVASEVVTGN